MSYGERKQYVLLVISDHPITPQDIDPSGVRHFINTEVKIEGSLGDGKGWRISQSVPKSCRLHPAYETELIQARGDTLSTVILNWLQGVCCSMSYQPSYRQRESAECKKEKILSALKKTMC